MIKFILCFETGRHIVAEDLYIELRKSKESTYIPKIFPIEDIDLYSISSGENFIEKLKAYEDDVYVLTDSIFSATILDCALSKVIVDYESFLVREKIFSLIDREDLKEGDIELIHSYLIKIENSRRVRKEIFVNAWRARMISEKVSDQIQKFVKPLVDDDLTWEK